jgi:hypothetical protein
MGSKICDSRFKKHFVVSESSESRITSLADQPSNAFTTTSLVTARVVMINRQCFSVWKTLANSADPSLCFPHAIKIFQRHVVPRQAEFLKSCGLVLLTSRLRALSAFFAACRATISSVASAVARPARITKTVLFKTVPTEVGNRLGLPAHWASFFGYDDFSHERRLLLRDWLDLSEFCFHFSRMGRTILT